MEVRVIIKRVLIGVAVLIVVGYSIFVLSGYLRGPRIILSTPQNGFSTTTPAIMVVGIAVRANSLTIDGAVVPLDLEGNFKDKLILAPGYNIITITAQDRYERTKEQKLEINLLPAK